MKLSEGSGVIKRVSLPFLLDSSKTSNKLIGVLNFNILIWGGWNFSRGIGTFSGGLELASGGVKPPPPPGKSVHESEPCLE